MRYMSLPVAHPSQLDILNQLSTTIRKASDSREFRPLLERLKAVYGLIQDPAE